MFTSKDVMELRQRTGVGMMDCKKALTECDGDMEKAVDFLREKGMATAAKKQAEWLPKASFTQPSKATKALSSK